MAKDPPYRIKNMMPGMIMGWHGSVASIPSGWHLCDGNAGTIDLRDKFIVGAGGALVPGATGGAAIHDHNFTGDGHNHTYQAGTMINNGEGFALDIAANNAVGTTDTADGRPPYYAFCWIQKL